MSTGAVLSEDIDEVVAKTKDAVDLVRLPEAPDMLGPESIALPPHFALTSDEAQIERTITLTAITVNPIAPQSHSFDTVGLQALLRDTISDVQCFDVLHPDYGE